MRSTLAIVAVTVMLAATLGVGTGAGADRRVGEVGHASEAAHTASSGSTCPVPASGPQYYAPSVRSGAKTVALTFDDGPGPSTPAILKILKSFGVRATFFNVGESETRWPSEVREEAADGFLVGNHSWSHPVMTGLSPEAQAAELDKVTAEQRSLVGSWPCAFRPPYGDYDATTLSLARARHMAVWMWSVDTEDWKAEGSGASFWVHRIIALAESEGVALQHPVVIMHNQSIPMPATVAALPTIIEFFEAHGYTFVDLLGRTGPPGSCGRAGGFEPPPGRELRSGATLGSGASIVTPGGQYRLSMQRGGDLVLSAEGGRPLWASDTTGNPGATLKMRTNGDLVVSSKGKDLWQSATTGHPGAWLDVRADGELAVVDDRGGLWSSHSTQSTLTPGERLEPGWYLQSSNFACRLIMQSNGDLVLFSSSRQVLWQSRTGTAPRATTVLERNGALELLSSVGAPLFSFGTQGNPGAMLTLARLGQVIVRSHDGATLWSSG